VTRHLTEDRAAPADELASQAPRHHDPGHRAAVAAIACQFPPRARYHRHYSRCKLLTDPLYQSVWEQLRTAPPLVLADLGCGLGLTGMYLRQRGWTGGYHGIDYDSRKIRLGRHLVERHYSGGPQEPFTLECGDLKDWAGTAGGHVALLDVLQYFNATQQRELLDRCVQAVAPGGLLVIRATLRCRHPRFRVNQACDWFARAVNWMRSPPVHYARGEEIAGQLRAHGLEGDFTPLWGRTPFCNWLGVFRRTATDAPEAPA